MRDLIHDIVSLLMWGLFGYYWYLVLGREIGPSTWRALLILAVVTGVGLGITIAWVIHNRRLARRMGRRHGLPPDRSEDFDRDSTGRRVHRPSLLDLRTAREIEIVLDLEGNKVYRVPQEKVA